MASLYEAFENRKFAKGQVQLPNSKLADPYIQHIIATMIKAGLTKGHLDSLAQKDPFLQKIEAIAKQAGVEIPTDATPATYQDVVDMITEKEQEMQKTVGKAPVLYHTLKNNVVESTVFDIFSKSNLQIPTPVADFSTTVFFRLVRAIRADQDEFFPLRSFIDRRRLQSPNFIFVGGNQPKSKYDSVATAAASPAGDFIFNIPFMESLMKYAHLKGQKPAGRKYVNNGGDIPDEFAPIEFLIMHEFMHFSNDDFYYQKILRSADGKQKANPTIINWVGDFRSNYLLCKSGYQALPMGLYSDEINYDRQKSYVDMYRLVEQEFNNLNEEDQEKTQNAMNNQSDDHEPGTEQGEESDTDTSDVDEGDIDENGKQIEKEMEGAKDAGKEEREQKDKQAQRSTEKSDQPGGPGRTTPGEVDYSKIAPRFNWKTLINRFVSSATPRTEETYAKPARRGVSGLEIARQVGAAAIKPAEKVTDMSEVALCFVNDSSGSMSGVTASIRANLRALLRQPAFKKTVFTMIRFSGAFNIFKASFATNKAAEVSSVAEKPRNMTLDAESMFRDHNAGGTVFDGGVVVAIAEALKLKYNVLLTTDSDILYGKNKENLLALIKASPGQMFVIFDSRATYIQFRQETGISTPNITHFS